MTFTISDGVQLVGAGLGIFSFVLLIIKILAQDRTWRHLVDGVRELLDDTRKDLAECRSERGAQEVRIQHLEGEVLVLRRELHLDRWVGPDEAAITSPPPPPPPFSPSST